MKYLRITFVVPILAVCIGFFLLALILLKDQTRHTEIVDPQCAHWAIFRTAQLIGIPTILREIQILLPNRSAGHTFAQVVEVLAKIGINAEGYRDDWDTLSKQNFPCIVHLTNPDHYIVVSGIEPKRGYIHIFDDTGNRTRLQREAFEKRWTGYSLHIKKNTDFFTTKSKSDSPNILFDYLILDKGDIPAIGEPTEFVFPVHNFGNRDLIIEDVKVNCGCLKSEKPTAPIPPGESGVVKLFYSVEPQRGVFNQSAAVKTNDPNTPTVLLSACGFTGVEVRIEPSRITLDRFFIGRETSYCCFVSYTGEWNDFQVELESTSLNGAKIISHECLPLDQANIASPLNKTEIYKPNVKNSRILKLTLEPTGVLADKVSGTIKLKTNISGYEHFTLHINGSITSPIQAFPEIIDLGKAELITFISLIDKPFSIVNVECDPALICRYDSSKQKKHIIRIVKEGIPKSRHLTIRCQLDNEPLLINIPLTILNDDL